MQQYFIQIDSFNICYYDSGISSKPTLLFVHGNSCNARIFIHQFHESITQYFRVVALDLPGHGYSSHSTQPEKDYNVITFGTIIEAFVNKLELSNLVLLGHSMGVNAVVESMINSSIRAKAFVFISGVPVDSPIPYEKVFKPNPHISLMGMAELTVENLQVISKEYFGGGEALFEFMRESVKHGDQAIRTYIFASQVNQEVAYLKKCSIPQWYVFGEYEEVYTSTYLDEVGLSLFEGKIHIIPNTGHFPMFDAHLVFNDALVQFLNKVL